MNKNLLHLSRKVELHTQKLNINQINKAFTGHRNKQINEFDTQIKINNTTKRIRPYPASELPIIRGRKKEKKKREEKKKQINYGRQKIKKATSHKILRDAMPIIKKKEKKNSKNECPAAIVTPNASIARGRQHHKNCKDERKRQRYGLKLEVGLILQESKTYIAFNRALVVYVQVQIL